MDQDEHLETWCFLLGLFFKALCIQHGGKAPKRKQRKRKLYFPKWMCDEAPRLNRTSTWGTLWKCHPFNLEKPLFFCSRSRTVFCNNLDFKESEGHTPSAAAPSYIHQMCVWCACAGTPGLLWIIHQWWVFSHMKVKADRHLLHHSVPSVNPSTQQRAINYSSLWLCERYVEALESSSQRLHHSSPLCSDDEPWHPQRQHKKTKFYS